METPELLAWALCKELVVQSGGEVEGTGHNWMTDRKL